MDDPAQTHAGYERALEIHPSRRLQRRSGGGHGREKDPEVSGDPSMLSMAGEDVIAAGMGFALEVLSGLFDAAIDSVGVAATAAATSTAVVGQIKPKEHAATQKSEAARSAAMQAEHTYTYTYAHTHIHIHICTYTCAHTHIHIHIPAMQAERDQEKADLLTY